ncbi:sugar ABC transporter substrate-binding protein, partial [Rhizobium sp. BR 314]
MIALATALGGSAAYAPSAFAIDVDKQIKDIESHPASGPNGEKATLASDLKLSAEEIEKIKAKHAKAAIVMHYT